MNAPKFFYLYLIIGIIELAIAIVTLVTQYPDVKKLTVISEFLMAIGFFYLAYKVYHEKKDHEMM
ncbi:hypothetical protein [Mucilaginibacter sp. KACC 22063]|uniref:hypothetical protein n=1 Tax=Mucilaginibacter sp. KACC 22063 TaxID=3025666 RepID=UPI00236685D2|nr:hypothetical protein [Mucilaginibacter sp. KACC 22063]WDF56653.1 hypothetical protein PQ461_06255 [Mucilaginibacter sp. KACC 22063]